MSLAKWCTMFDEPVVPEGYPYELGVIIDRSMVGLPIYITFELLDAAGTAVQVLSEQLEENSFGNVVRIPLPPLGMFPDVVQIRAFVSDEDLTEPIADFYLVDDQGEFVLDDLGNPIRI